MVNVVHQFQFIGKPDSRLLEDDFFKRIRDSGITSLQSYFLWSEIEKKENVFDFSAYDCFIEKLLKFNIKWTPFLIAAPFYATPSWFFTKKDSLFSKCLEHNMNSKIQSIWNIKFDSWIERFIYKFNEHYSDQSFIESILIGTSGNWGEFIYPAEGGFTLKEKFHTHKGFWCGDELAHKDYINYLILKYNNNIRLLNESWNKRISSFYNVRFPDISCDFVSNKSLNAKLDFRQIVSRILPRDLKEIVKGIYFGNKIKTAKVIIDNEWLDFMDWYISSMNNYMDRILKITRKILKNNKIYAVTGGDGDPRLGACYSSQVEIAKKYNCGIRITNQNDDYAESMVITRLISTSSKAYENFYSTEEAGYTSAAGVSGRIYDAVTSKVDAIYFKSLFNIVDNITGYSCKPSEEINKVPLGFPTKAYDSFLRNLKWLDEKDIPVRDIAIFYPNTMIKLNRDYLINYYSVLKYIRKYLDYDIIDENLIMKKIDFVKRYKILLFLKNTFVPDEIKKKIDTLKNFIEIMEINNSVIKSLNKKYFFSNTDYPTLYENYLLSFKKAGVIDKKLIN